MKKIVLFFIKFYQMAISPLFSARAVCRFVPSCSEYAKQAVEKHGAIRGGWMALRRISRCHPGGGFGFDPVP